QQRLGRDAAPVEADAAEVFALHESGFHAELRRADGGDVAARAAAQHDEVEALVRHWLLPVRRAPCRAVPWCASRSTGVRRACDRSRWTAGSRSAPAIRCMRSPRPA